jgi:hypothetical protein
MSRPMVARAAVAPKSGSGWCVFVSDFRSIPGFDASVTAGGGSRPVHWHPCLLRRFRFCSVVTLLAKVAEQ